MKLRKNSAWKHEPEERVLVKKAVVEGIACINVPGTVLVLNSNNSEIERRYYVDIEDVGPEWRGEDELAKAQQL